MRIGEQVLDDSRPNKVEGTSENEGSPRLNCDIEPLCQLVGWDAGTKAAPSRLFNLMRKSSNPPGAKFGVIQGHITHTTDCTDLCELYDIVTTHQEHFKFKKSPSPEAVVTAMGKPESVIRQDFISADLRSVSCEYWVYYDGAFELVFSRGSDGPEKLIGWFIKMT